MADELTLGRMVYGRLNHLGMVMPDGKPDYDAAHELTGISKRHLRRILEDEGFFPQERIRDKLGLLGLTQREILDGAVRSKSKSIEARLVPA